MNAPLLRQPEATSFPRLPQRISAEFSHLDHVEADEATCFNPYVWRCDGLFFLCRDIKRGGKGCLICLKADETRFSLERSVWQPRVLSCLRLPQVASPVWLS